MIFLPNQAERENQAKKKNVIRVFVVWHSPLDVLLIKQVFDEYYKAGTKLSTPQEWTYLNLTRIFKGRTYYLPPSPPFFFQKRQLRVRENK